MQKTNMELEALSDLFKSAWLFLKKTSLNITLKSNKKLIELPWFLAIGAPNSGKTQLVLQSGLKPAAVQNFAFEPNDEAESERRCNWWFTQDATFIDVPGSYLPVTAGNDTSSVEWKQFLEVLKTYIKMKPLNGIILTLALPDWWLKSKSEQKALVQNLREMLHALAKLLKTATPLYLVLTKADQIAGFSDFFADLGQEERSQAWGFNLNENKSTNTSLPRLFKNQFDQLLKRLHMRLIWRLHNERNLQKRVLIQHFPLQMECLKNGLANLLYQLADVIALYQTTSLRGVYLVSSLQQGMPVDCLHATLSETLALSPQLAPLPSLSDKQQSFFSKQFFQKVLLNNNNNHKTQRPLLSQQTNVRATAYIGAILLVMGSGLYMAHNFNEKVSHLNKAQTALTQYEILNKQLPASTQNIKQALPALNSIEQANTSLKQFNSNWLTPKGQSLSPLANKAYESALTSYFLPGLATVLAQALVNNNQPGFLYGALKVYLMLGDPSHFDANFIQQWFNNYWQQTLHEDPALEKQMENHLAALLTQPVRPITLKPDVINKARNMLNALPPAALAYAILKSESDNTPVMVFAGNNEKASSFKIVFGDKDNFTIPRFYTSDSFVSMFTKQIKTASDEVVHGNWVVGSNPNSLLVVNNANDNLSDQVKLLYAHDYAQQWLALLAKLQVPAWQTWQQAKPALEALASHHSPLLTVLQTVAENTSSEKLLANAPDVSATDKQLIKSNISDVFANVNNLLQKDGDAESPIEDTDASLADLQEYMADINDDGSKAFDAAKKRFASDKADDPIRELFLTAKDVPAPLQTWVTTIASSSWHLILTSTASYLNKTWVDTVLPVYNSHINNRYPLFKNAHEDIDLTEFTRFFAPDQLLDTYFKNYMAPFMDTTQAQWHWRSVDGQTLNLAPELLTQMERAAIIRTMFFNNKDALDVQFSLQPVAMEEGVTSITLQINGQQMVDQPDAAGSHKVTWPSDTKYPSATLIITDNHGQQANSTEDGSWALFHLLDKANLQPTSNTQNFLLTFDLKGNAARYQLIANKLINPFIPGIVDHFRCPTVLN